MPCIRYYLDMVNLALGAAGCLEPFEISFKPVILAPLAQNSQACFM